MKRRLLVAIAIVLLVMTTGGAFAANSKPPKCWYVGYSLQIWGDEIFEIGPNCVPCLGLCPMLPPPPPALRGTSADSAPAA